MTGASPIPKARTASAAWAVHRAARGAGVEHGQRVRHPDGRQRCGDRRQVDRGRPTRDHHQVREPGRFRSAARLPGCRVDHHQGRAGIGRGLDHPGQPGRVRCDHHRGDALAEPSPHRRRSLRVQVDYRRLSADELMGRRKGKGEGRFPASALICEITASVRSMVSTLALAFRQVKRGRRRMAPPDSFRGRALTIGGGRRESASPFGVPRRRGFQPGGVEEGGLPCVESGLPLAGLAGLAGVYTRACAPARVGLANSANFVGTELRNGPGITARTGHLAAGQRRLPTRPNGFVDVSTWRSRRAELNREPLSHEEWSG